MTVLTTLIAIGLLATVTSLVVGVGAMGHGGEFDQRHATQLMFARVGSQAITILVLLIALAIVHL